MSVKCDIELWNGFFEAQYKVLWWFLWT